MFLSCIKTDSNIDRIPESWLCQVMLDTFIITVGFVAQGERQSILSTEALWDRVACEGTYLMRFAAAALIGNGSCLAFVLEQAPSQWLIESGVGVTFVFLYNLSVPFFSLIFEMFQIKAIDISLIFHGLVLILFFSYVLIAYFWNLTKPQLPYIRLYQRSRGIDW